MQELEARVGGPNHHLPGPGVLPWVLQREDQIRRQKDRTLSIPRLAVQGSDHPVVEKPSAAGEACVSDVPLAIWHHLPLQSAGLSLLD